MPEPPDGGQFLYWLGIALLAVPAALWAAILALVRRRRLFTRFPLFAAYTAYVLICTVLKLVTLSNRGLYFYVYWFSEPGEVILSILSVYESFIRVFGDFYRLVWFRILFPGTIILALSYSAWYAYAHPPEHAKGWAAAIISTAVAAQCITLGISVLFFALLRLLNIPSRVYESRIVMGFGVSSVVYALSGVLRSEGAAVSVRQSILAGDSA